MQLATSLLQQFGFLRARAAETGPPMRATPDDPAHLEWEEPGHLEREESGHRLANLLQIVVCNLERAAGGTAKLPAGDAKDQVSAACRLQDLLDPRNTAGRPVAGHLRALGGTLDALMLRPAGHRLTVEVEAATEELLLPAQALSGLGQLVVEAVMNAAKHAFSAGPGGTVALKLSRAGPWLSCVIADDGVGSRGTPGRIGSRGMALTGALAERAGGRCRWVFGQHGTEVRITWPVTPTANETAS